MSHQNKFLFETSFDDFDAEQETTASAPASPPQFSETDLARAREEGFAAGRQAGAQEAEQATEQAMAQTLAAVAEQLPAMLMAQREAIEHQSREAIELALSITRKLFPKLAQRHGLDEIESLVAECLERLREEPRVVIRVADSLLDPVGEQVNGLAARAAYEGKIVLLSEDGLAPGDARVEWADGGAERDSRQLWQEIDSLVERTIGANPSSAAEVRPDSSRAQTGGSDATGSDSADGAGARAVVSA